MEEWGPAILSAIAPTLAVLTASWIANRNARRARVEAKVVSQKLDVTTATTNKKLEKIHKLVNSSMEEQLRLTAVALRRVAELTGDTSDALLAGKAQGIYEAHSIAQERLKEED